MLANEGESIYGHSQDTLRDSAQCRAQSRDQGPELRVGGALAPRPRVDSEEARAKRRPHLELRTALHLRPVADIVGFVAVQQRISSELGRNVRHSELFQDDLAQLLVQPSDLDLPACLLVPAAVQADAAPGVLDQLPGDWVVVVR